MERLQQNMFINAPTISQIAAEASFDDVKTALTDNVESYKSVSMFISQDRHLLYVHLQTISLTLSWNLYIRVKSDGSSVDRSRYRLEATMLLTIWTPIIQESINREKDKNKSQRETDSLIYKTFQSILCNW